MNSSSPLGIADAISRRYAVRRFRPEPVPRDVLDKAFALAQQAPSNCNTQPWLVRVASGAAAERMKAALLAESAEQRFSIDIPFDPATFTDPCKARYAAHGATLHEAHGVSRDDVEGRKAMLRNNVACYGAPHIAFFFMPAWGNERQASDVGMFAQSFSLALMSFGVSTCPQAVLSFFADTVRREFNMNNDYKLLYGMSVGYADTDDPTHQVRHKRAELSEVVRYFDE